MKEILSLVVPVYFEEECIDHFISECRKVLETQHIDYEFVFVDDGSGDRTTEIIKRHAIDDARIKLVELSYNHGKQAAVTAGIHYALGDFLIYMDPDLQDPPYEIPHFLDKIREGYDIVYGVRNEKQDSFVNALFSSMFWYVLRRLTGLPIPDGMAVMRIFNRRFADQFMKYREQNRFIEGIFIHIGMKNTSIPVDQMPRFAGKSKFDFRKKFRLAANAILDFSELPLKLATRLGLALSVVGFAAILTVLTLKLTVVDFQAGWPSLLSVLLLGFGLQLFFIGLVAQYVGKIYSEAKQRPLYSVKSTTNLTIAAPNEDRQAPARSSRQGVIQ